MDSGRRPPPPGRPRHRYARDPYVRFLGVGVQFAVTVALLASAGYWLDGKLGTLPLFLIVGVLLGVLGSTISLILAARRLPSRSGGGDASGKDASNRPSTDLPPPPPR